MPLLSIAIPTYNRAAKLQAQIERLLPQLTPEVKLCIYDNASTDSTRETVCKYLSKGISYFCAKTNCGGERNFFRCFEDCQTDWLWILGDDDIITTDAVGQLLSVIGQQECDYVQASSHLCIFKSDIIVSDFPSLFQHANFASLLWLSTGVYKVASFRPLFCLYNQAMSTYAPQAIIVLCLLEAHKGKVFLSSISLTDCPKDNQVTWSTLDFISHVCLLPEYLSNSLYQKILAEQIWKEHMNWSFLVGLREITNTSNARRWQRLWRLVRHILKYYKARSPIYDILWNWYKSGQRKQTLAALQSEFCINVLAFCPPSFVLPILKLVPLPKWALTELKQRGKKTASITY